MKKIYALIFILGVWDIVIKNIGNSNVTVNFYPPYGESFFRVPVEADHCEIFTAHVSSYDVIARSTGGTGGSPFGFITIRETDNKNIVKVNGDTGEMLY